MKLYVIDKGTGLKKYLRQIAPNRQALARELGSSYFVIDRIHYSVNDVSAEASSDSTAIGGVLGGIVGALGGAAGVVVGGLLGAAIGQKQAEKEKKDAETFNERGLIDTLF